MQLVALLAVSWSGPGRPGDVVLSGAELVAWSASLDKDGYADATTVAHDGCWD